jgi:DNA-directed RNA polymerase subunit RPC12/RpoP
MRAKCPSCGKVVEMELTYIQPGYEDIPDRPTYLCPECGSHRSSGIEPVKGDCIFLYEVTNRITRERQVVGAHSAQEACKKVGWMIGNCFVGEKIPYT